jgi:predicted nuclease of restriction endonuclease-like (RecB) superfamily
MKTNILSNNNAVSALYDELKVLIDTAKSQIAIEVNATMTNLYWEIGKHINQYILHNKRAEYGKQIVVALSRQLQQEYGNSSFSEKNIRRMMQFAVAFPDEQIVVALSRQFSWSHFMALIPIEDKNKREFYIEMAKIEHWSYRTLRDRISSMLYERTAISKKPDKTIEKELAQLKDTQEITPDIVFRDPYFLNFLGLHDTYSEKDLESAILAELQNFIGELGTDFAFLARQKRITVDNEDYYIDLLFFHRRLRCLVALELKLGEFKAAYKGQMELYLRWLEKYERVEGENKPIGLILCAGKNEEHIELMHLDESNIRVAEYMTELPKQEILEQKLLQAINRAKAKLAITMDGE